MATQQEINDFVEQIMPYFDPTPVEDDAVRQSWPRLDRGLSDVQDMARFQHLYGIIDNGEYGYWLEPHASDSETNQANTLFLTAGRDGRPAEATLRGCFHRLRETVELEFPPVAVPTTQYVVIEYDPVRSADGGDPLVEKVVTSLDRSQGKDYLLLHAVERRPSQLLSNAPIHNVRPRAAGTVYAWEESHKPDPASVLWGTICVVGQTQSIYRSSSGSWDSLTDPDWEEYGDTPTYVHPGFGYRRAIQRVGKRRRLRGNVRRRDNSAMPSTSTGYLMFTLADGDIPQHSEKFIVAGAGNQNPAVAAIIVGGRSDSNLPGEVRVYPKGPTTWVSLSGISWDV